MRKRKRHVLSAQSGGEFGCFAVKPNRGAASRLSEYFDVPPSHAAAPAGAEGLHRSFLCGKARSKSFYSISFRVAVANFLVSEHPAQKPVAKSLHRFGYAWHFGDVNSCAYDHEGYVSTAWNLHSYMMPEVFGWSGSFQHLRVEQGFQPCV